MAVVFWELGRAAVIDELSATMAVASLLLLVRWAPNSAWLIAAGGLLGLIRRIFDAATDSSPVLRHPP